MRARLFQASIVVFGATSLFIGPLSGVPLNFIKPLAAWITPS